MCSGAKKASIVWPASKNKEPMLPSGKKFLSLLAITQILYMVYHSPPPPPISFFFFFFFFFFKLITADWVEKLKLLIQKQLNCLADHPGCFWKCFLYSPKVLRFPFTYLQLSLSLSCRTNVCRLPSYLLHSQSVPANGCHGNAFPGLWGLYRLTVHWPSKLKWQSRNKKKRESGERATAQQTASKPHSVKSLEKPEKTKMVVICKDPHMQVSHLENSCGVWKK